MSEEEFGLPSNGPISLPCDSIFMEYILLIIRQGISEELAKASLSFVISCSLFSAVHQESDCPQLQISDLTYTYFTEENPPILSSQI
ncbi:Small auxin-up RNA [Dillenia turbinata]|uniref:Small auxin-up RNA n=1 Tax=Dillenia turbinata TaxID=194707 RepID=A0AAN8UT65_9MAGN